jgi:hypothetical protein
MPRYSTRGNLKGRYSLIYPQTFPACRSRGHFPGGAESGTRIIWGFAFGLGGCGHMRLGGPFGENVDGVGTPFRYLEVSQYNRLFSRGSLTHFQKKILKVSPVPLPQILKLKFQPASVLVIRKKVLEISPAPFYGSLDALVRADLQLSGAIHHFF